MDRTFGDLSGCPSLVVIARTSCPHGQIRKSEALGVGRVKVELAGKMCDCLVVWDGEVGYCRYVRYVEDGSMFDIPQAYGRTGLLDHLKERRGRQIRADPAAVVGSPYQFCLGIDLSLRSSLD